MGFNLTGWKHRELDEKSTMCSRPELENPIKRINEFWFGHHWALWTSGKVSEPFQAQIMDIVEIMEATLGDTRPGFAFKQEEIDQFLSDAADMYEKYGEDISTTWM